MAESNMGRLKEIQADMESFQSGVGRFEMGMPRGWHYPMMYKADEVPPVLEKQRMIHALTGVPPTTHVDITDEDRAVIKKKQDTIDEASFDAWLLDQYRPWEHPAFKAYFLQKYPHFQDKMEAAIKKKAEFQLRAQVEALKDTPEGDMFRFQMTQHPEMQTMLSDPLGPEQANERGHGGIATAENVHAQAEFQRGLLNPFKLARANKLADLGGLIYSANPEIQARGVRQDQYGGNAWGQTISPFFHSAPGPLPRPLCPAPGAAGPYPVSSRAAYAPRNGIPVPPIHGGFNY